MRGDHAEQQGAAVDEGVTMKSVYAGVDLGGTNFSVALADETGQIIAETKQPTLSHEGPPAVLDRIATQLGTLAQQSGVRPVALGMGVGTGMQFNHRHIQCF